MARGKFVTDEKLFLALLRASRAIKNENPGDRLGATRNTNPAHLPQNLAKSAKPAVLFSW